MALTDTIKTLSKDASGWLGGQLGGGRSPASKSAESQKNTRLAATLPLWPASLTFIALLSIIFFVFLLPFDATVSRLMVGIHSPVMEALRSVTQLGLTGFYLAGFLILWLICFGIKRIIGNNNAHDLVSLLGRQSFFAVVALLSSGVVVTIIKNLIGRARPFLIDSVGPFYFSPMSFSYSYISFPSGHACTTGVMAMLLSLWLPRFKVPVFLICLIVASSRVAVNAHYPSDVFAGFSIGCILTLIFARFLGQRELAFTLGRGKLFPEIIK